MNYKKFLQNDILTSYREKSPFHLCNYLIKYIYQYGDVELHIDLSKIKIKSSDLRTLLYYEDKSLTIFKNLIDLKLSKKSLCSKFLKYFFSLRPKNYNTSFEFLSFLMNFRDYNTEDVLNAFSFHIDKKLFLRCIELIKDKDIPKINNFLRDRKDYFCSFDEFVNERYDYFTLKGNVLVF